MFFIKKLHIFKGRQYEVKMGMYGYMKHSKDLNSNAIEN